MTIDVNNTKVCLQLETGSDVTLLSRKTWEDIGRPTLRPTTSAPVDAQAHSIPLLGEATPVQFSPFAAPIVIVKKASGAIRICGDYSTGLNNILESNHYPVPTQIFSGLAGATEFSKIDLSDAYLQVEMDDEAKSLLTINTHRGLYTFNRLCPGVKPACAIFQQAVDQVLAGIPNARAYFDDILIYSNNKNDHLHTLRLVLTRLKFFNFRANPDKCEFFKPDIHYLGIIINKDGQRPDPEKTRAITEMPSPTNAAEVRSFLGAVGFYAKFIRNMSEIRAPLDRLMKKDVKFHWDAECEAAVNKFRKLLIS